VPGSRRCHRGRIEDPGCPPRLDRGATHPGDVTDSGDAVVARTFHEEWGRIVATLIGITGDWDLAEECAQDAFTRALEVWTRDGIPDAPRAWLRTNPTNTAY